MTSFMAALSSSDSASSRFSVAFSASSSRSRLASSLGSRGDSYDNALAETINGLYKTGYLLTIPASRLPVADRIGQLSCQYRRA